MNVRKEVRSPQSNVTEEQWEQHVLTLAARGGWHGLHIRRSHGTLEGLHGQRRPFPRGADHDDALGFPDLLLVNPERMLLVFAELKTEDGRLSPPQQDWQDWLQQVSSVTADIWRPSADASVRALLMGD